MYNGIGLATARGSGTNGYVVKNLSAFRPREGPPGGFGSGANFGSMDDFPKHRQPDQGILEHEKKRQVEVRCAELADELEEKGFPEDEILEQVDALRSKLLAALPSSGPRDPKTLKQSDTHSIAQAKELELTRMRGAFGLSSNYKEGASFDKEEQERLRVLKRAEYEEKDRVRAERMAAMQKAEEERKEVEKKRRRDEERARKAAEKEASKRPPPRDLSPPPPARFSTNPSSSSRRSPSPSPRGSDNTRRRSRSPAAGPSSYVRAPAPADPVTAGSSSTRPQRSPSPPARRGRRDSSTPPRRRRRYTSDSDSDSDSDGDSRSPPPRKRREDSRSRERRD